MISSVAWSHWPALPSSSVNPSPHMIATTARHPILEAAKQWIISKWDTLESQYPGSDPSSIYNRVKHRGFRALSVGIQEAYARAGRKDVVFPPNYFSLAKTKNALFAVHGQLGTWYKKTNANETKTNRLLKEIKQEFSYTYWMGLFLATINICLGIFSLKLFVRQNKRRKK